MHGYEITHTDTTGHPWNLIVQFETYQKGGRAIELYEADGERYGVATAWVPGLAHDEVAIRDYNEMTGILASLMASAIVKAPHRSIPSGFVRLPVCRLSCIPPDEVA